MIKRFATEAQKITSAAAVRKEMVRSKTESFFKKKFQSWKMIWDRNTG